ncbi:phosphotransferase [Parasphingorhabdus halotolerans]|uniref:Phosphotransferase n=1 Tax=Parasphingorhabdus halotolerans TaxID=2725558 RepID=A0A6H2DMG0_9SPHN|nr:phosphotransferase [Parasphingorhabdus halotolerans]QJB69570.1 phosphotransferase [Parasphingorhabdus halotolerans]
MSAAFPLRPEDFNPGFVERVFNAPAQSLLGLTYEPVGTGQVCDSYRFVCDWVGDDGPATFVAKCPSANEISRGAAAIFHLYDMEVGWYRDIAEHCDALCPKCYHADIAENEQEFVLLLEDMAPASQGDQLAGASLVQVKTTLAEAAALHSFRPEGGFASYKWLHHGKDNSQFLVNTLQNGYPVFRDRFSSLLTADILDLGQQLVDRIGNYVAREPLEQTITHGDMRLDNILYQADGRIAALVDWQTCSLGNPANDVAYLIGTSFADPAVRRAEEKQLVEDYLATRTSAQDFDAFWNEYRRHAFSGFLMAINASLHVEQTERGDAMFAAMAERPAQMAMDLDSLSLL